MEFNKIKMKTKFKGEIEYSTYKPYDYQENSIAFQIRIISEVEKIWIVYDRNQDGMLDYDEISEYLQNEAYPDLTLTELQLHKIFSNIDIDGSGYIDKKELEVFVTKLLMLNKVNMNQR